MNRDASLAILPVTGPYASPVAATAYDDLLVNMAYRTEAGREATVVFNGNEDDFDCELAPIRDTAEQSVRVMYTDNQQPDWYDGLLTPIGWVRKPVAVEFKDETDLDGETAGPMRVLFEHERDRSQTARRYSPNRRRAPWVLRSHAENVAASLGLALTER